MQLPKNRGTLLSYLVDTYPHINNTVDHWINTSVCFIIDHSTKICAVITADSDLKAKLNADKTRKPQSSTFNQAEEKSSGSMRTVTVMLQWA